MAFVDPQTSQQGAGLDRHACHAPGVVGDDMRLIHFGDHKHTGGAGAMGLPAIDPLPLLLAVGIEHKLLPLGQHPQGRQAPLGQQVALVFCGPQRHGKVAPWGLNAVGVRRPGGKLQKCPRYG